MTIIGPNCSGFMTSHYSGKFAGIIPELKPRTIDFINGKGATVDLVMEQAVLRGLAFCNVVNVEIRYRQIGGPHRPSMTKTTISRGLPS